MSRRAWWIAGFLGVTVAAIVAELWASFDGSASTTPWTDLVVEYVPGEVTLAVLGALLVWLPVHFFVRYRRRASGRRRESR